MNAVRFSLAVLLLSLCHVAAADAPILGVAFGDEDVTRELPAADARESGISGHGLVLASCTELEPNERTTNASSIDVPGLCSGLVGVGDPFFMSIVYSSGNDGVEDLFRVVLPSSAQLYITLNFTAGNLDLFLFNSTLLDVLHFDNSTTGVPETITTATLPPGTYYIGVSARSGSASYVVSVDVLGGATPPPAAPSNLVATGIDQDTIRLNWTDNSSNETSFVIQLLNSGGTFSDVAPLLPANTTVVDVNGFPPGTMATFRVKARNAGGDSSASNQATATTTGGATSPPAAPSNLVAAAIDSDTIRLTWSDNSSNEASFVVQQMNSGGTFTDLPPLLAANTTTLDVNGLAPGTTATFRVAARNSGGDSGYSNQATATTTGGFGCVPNDTTACLLNNRFRVTINYVNPFSTPPNQSGTFRTTRLTPAPGINPDVALFGFLSADAVEVIVRLWDARPFAPRFDVFIGGLTDVQYTVAIRDMLSGREFTHVNQVGQVGGRVDRVAFPAP